MADKMMRVSDLSQQPANNRVQWSVANKRYVLDLTDKELADFEKLLKPYVDASRTPPRCKRKASSAKPSV